MFAFYEQNQTQLKDRDKFVNVSVRVGWSTEIEHIKKSTDKGAVEKRQMAPIICFYIGNDFKGLRLSKRQGAARREQLESTNISKQMSSKSGRDPTYFTHGAILKISPRSILEFYTF